VRSIVVVRVCGPWRSREDVEAVLPGWVFEVTGRDAALATQFGEHSGVVTVMSEPYGPEEAARVVHQLLDAGVALLDAGGVGVAGDTRHTPERWRELAARAAAAAAALQGAADPRASLEARLAFWRALWEAWVRAPAAHGPDVLTRGMHVLGRPDAVVALDDLVAEGEEALAEAATLLERFTLLLLAGAADDLTGQSFALGKDALQYTIVREQPGPWPNPWGYWRLSR